MLHLNILILKGSGDFMGIDIEIANAITEKLGYELEIQDMDFSGLISALQSGQADFVMAAMSATEDRKKSVDFSDVYYTSKHVVVSKKDSGFQNGRRLSRFKSWGSIGIYSRGEDERTFRNTGFTYESRDRVPLLIQEIMAGNLDAAIIEDTVAQGYLEKNQEVEGFTVEDAEGGYAIAFPKESELTEEFNNALKEMIDNGEIDTIVKKYFK